MPLEPNYYNIVSRAIEEGVAYGYQCAHKYVDQPEEDVIKDEIHSAVMSALGEVFMFPSSE